MKIEKLVEYYQPKEYEWLDIWRTKFIIQQEKESVKTVPNDRLTRFFLWLEKMIDKVVGR